jgi:hypothetical protein
MSAIPETSDLDATLAALDTEEGYGPAAVEREPAQEPATTQVPETTPETPATTTQPETPTEEVRVTKAEWEQMQRTVGQYGSNLEQQRREFDQRVQQAIAGQGPEIERRIGDARREERRATLREQIGQIADPTTRAEYQRTHEQQWQQEDAQVAAQRAREEAERIRQQATTQTQQAQAEMERARGYAVAANAPALLGAYAPLMTQLVTQSLGQPVDAAEVQAYLARPQVIKMVQREALKGKDAVDALGYNLADAIAIHVQDRAAQRTTETAANREERDRSGLGRGQGGAVGGQGGDRYARMSTADFAKLVED